jgi:hypothetical protein
MLEGLGGWEVYKTAVGIDFFFYSVFLLEKNQVYVARMRD